MNAPAKSRLKRGGVALIALTALVGGFEGVSTYAYRDPVGVPTICFGETRNVHLGDTATMAQCKTMLGDRLVEFSAGVDKCLIAYVPDKSYAAFVSLSYNIGLGNFCHSTAVKRANAGDLRGACEAILMFTRAHGIVLPGLVKRRQAERDLCIQGATS